MENYITLDQNIKFIKIFSYSYFIEPGVKHLKIFFHIVIIFVK